MRAKAKKVGRTYHAKRLAGSAAWKKCPLPVLTLAQEAAKARDVTARGNALGGVNAITIER